MWRMVIEQRTTRPYQRHTLKHQNSRRIHGYLNSSSSGSHTARATVCPLATSPSIPYGILGLVAQPLNPCSGVDGDSYRPQIRGTPGSGVPGNVLCFTESPR